MRRLLYTLLICLAVFTGVAKAQKPDSIKLNGSKEQNFPIVEITASFPGGLSNFYRFLGSQLIYPANAIKNKVGGAVTVSFIVNKDGSLSDIKAINPPSEDLGNEAIRVVRLSPHWRPGIQNGKQVTVQFSIKINFDLNAVLNASNASANKNAEDVNNALVENNLNTLPQTDEKSSISIMDVFPGGAQALSMFLSQHLIYPANAVKNKIEGQVLVSFIIKPNGKLDSIKVLRSPSEDLSKEAVRVLNLSPRWKPAMKDLKAVKIQISLPITFDLGKDTYNPSVKIDSLADDKTKFFFVEIPPEYPGGEEALGRFLIKNLRYPQKAQSNKIQGKVFVSFVVEKNGSLTEITIEKSLSDDTDLEALRLINLFPRWKPGIQGGHLVRVKYTIPIAFNL